LSLVLRGAGSLRGSRSLGGAGSLGGVIETLGGQRDFGRSRSSSSDSILCSLARSSQVGTALLARFIRGLVKGTALEALNNGNGSCRSEAHIILLTLSVVSNRCPAGAGHRLLLSSYCSGTYTQERGI